MHPSTTMSLACEEYRRHRPPKEDLVNVNTGNTDSDPIPMTLHDQLKLSRLKASQERSVGRGHRKAYSEFNMASLSTSIIEDIDSAVEEPSSSSHPFFKKIFFNKNQESQPHSIAASPSSVVPAEMLSFLQSLSLDSPGKRAAHHRRNKTAVPVSFTPTPSTTTASSIKKASPAKNLALDEDDLRKLIKQLEAIVEDQAEEIKHLHLELDEWRARAHQH